MERLLKKGDVPYHLEMTKYGGHARDLVLGSREKEMRPLDCGKCSGVLVIGGDGTVCEVCLCVCARLGVCLVSVSMCVCVCVCVFFLCVCAQALWALMRKHM